MTGSNGQEHVFQSLWIGGRLSPLERLCIKSFLEHGHRFVLYAYQEVDEIPPGCQIEDARAIVSEAEVFLYAPGLLVGSPAGFSDRFRYEVLKARGGWWVDTDVLCLRADIADTPYVFAKESDRFYNGAVLKAPRESEFLARALTHARVRARASGGEMALNELGPRLVSRLVRELALEAHAWKREDIYPLGWKQVLDFLDPSRADQIEALVASSTFVHLYTNMLRIANVSKDVRPPEGSYLDRLYAAYGIEFPAYPRYEWSEIEPQYALQRAHWDLGEEADLLRAEAERLRGQAASTDELRRQLHAKEIEAETLASELAVARQETARIEQSVTIQLFRRLSNGFYELVGRQSLLGRTVQASLRLIGRVLLRSAES